MLYAPSRAPTLPGIHRVVEHIPEAAGDRHGGFVISWHEMQDVGDVERKEWILGLQAYPQF